MIGPRVDSFIAWGGLAGDLVRSAPSRQYFRLFTASWLHSGVVHLVLNGFAEIGLVLRLERFEGPVRTLLIWIISGLGGNVTSAVFGRSNTVGVGASGSICGVVGALAAQLFVNFDVARNKWWALLYWIVAATTFIGIGVIPIFDNFMHSAGFLTGFFSGLFLTSMVTATPAQQHGSPTFSSYMGVMSTTVLSAPLPGEKRSKTLSLPARLGLSLFAGLWHLPTTEFHRVRRRRVVAAIGFVLTLWYFALMGILLSRGGVRNCQACCWIYGTLNC
ncbi:rhomboid-domain-containing protein [Gonapodya prolifera JEL478]|uniref:Rhomboid-type serine protease n=1 Tax=Gonapodya prolifera (strain JEL478) TaxID=1344416 RepID=A0A139B0M0_GONPJ|nr:rhomboid-domain-containing protein [Gonapodya prolifera JEL478]|eukprot:KXS22541.1 rhomboid-domain-containing protein [Gonapodya prolifera JEL478]